MAANEHIEFLCLKKLWLREEVTLITKTQSHDFKRN